MQGVSIIPSLDEDLKFQSYGAFSEWTYALINIKKLQGARVDQIKIDNNLQNAKIVKILYQVVLSVLKNLARTWFKDLSRFRLWDVHLILGVV